MKGAIVREIGGPEMSTERQSKEGLQMAPDMSWRKM